MGSSTIQGQLWGANAADWVDLQAPMGRPVWEAMLSAAEVRQGARFFDAGCGGGGASILAADRGADVTGLDASEALIEIARQRLPKGTFDVGELEELPYEDDSFDVTFAALSIMFAENPVNAMRELTRVTTPDGGVVVSTWGLPEQCDMRHVFSAVVGTLPSPPPGDGPFALSGEGELGELLQQADLTDIETGEVAAPFEYQDFDHLWRAQRSAGPLQGAIQTAGEKNVREAVREAVKPFQDSNGIRLNNRFKYAIGRA